MKTCSKCKVEKELVFFNKDLKSKDKKQSYCKACKNNSMKIYYRNNPTKRTKRTKEQGRERYRKNKVNYNFSRQIRKSLNGSKNGSSWESLVNYNLLDLKNHLESLFLDGMSWDNYGKWHIDHIIPQDSFNITSSKCIDFKKCWSLSNLQPLWAKDNILKSNSRLV